MADDVTERSVAPTPRRRQQARRDGQVARSPDLTAAAVVLVALTLIAACGMKIVTALQSFVARAIASSDRSLRELSHESLLVSVQLLAPIFAGVFIVALAAQLLQVGFHFDMSRLRPSFGRMRRRVFRTGRLAQGAVNLVKLLCVALLIWSLMRSRIMQIAMLQELSVGEIGSASWEIVYAIGIRLAGLLLLLGGLDFAFRRWRLEKQLQMTPREMKEELRQMEGDPRIRQRRRQLAMRMIRSRGWRELGSADVVATHGLQYAIALKYDPAAMTSPRVLGCAQGTGAGALRDLAAAHRVKIIDQPAAQLLVKACRGATHVPPDLYAAAAEILAAVKDKGANAVI